MPQWQQEEEKMIRQKTGYKGSTEKWRVFLSEWQVQIAEITGGGNFDFQNFDGTNNAKYLNEKFNNLPKSYLEFIEAGGNNLLSIANWEDPIAGYPSFFEKEKVDLFKKYQEKYDEYNQDDYAYDIEIDADYFKYSGGNTEYDLNDLEKSLLIGEEGPGQVYGIFLLNPIHISEDKEWEGWFWAPNITGGIPRRYPSFAHLVAQKYVTDLVLMGKSSEPILYFNKDWEDSKISEIIEII